MNKTTIHRGRFLLIAALTLLVTFAATAAGARAIAGQPDEAPDSGLQYVTHTMSAAAVSHATGVAQCPEGTTAIAGGVSSDTGFTRVITSAARSGGSGGSGGSGWSVSLWNLHPSRSLTAHVWAQCVAVD
jgi:hypothetical protein